MAVLRLLPDWCTRPSSARPKRVTRKDRGTRGTEKQCRQHNRRVSAKICPVQISTPTRLDKTGVLSRPSGYRVPGTGRSPRMYEEFRRRGGASRAGGFSLFVLYLRWRVKYDKLLGTSDRREMIQNDNLIISLHKRCSKDQLIFPHRSDASLTLLCYENPDPATIPCR